MKLKRLIPNSQVEGKVKSYEEVQRKVWVERNGKVNLPFLCGKRINCAYRKRS